MFLMALHKATQKYRRGNGEYLMEIMPGVEKSQLL